MVKVVANAIRYVLHFYQSEIQNHSYDTQGIAYLLLELVISTAAAQVNHFRG